jgi:hypothetical protein
MNMPGFIAEASQAKTIRHYGLAAAFAQSSLAADVVPAKCFNEGWCGDCDPVKHAMPCCINREIEWIECEPSPRKPGTPPPTSSSCRKICCVDGQPQLT